MRKYQKTKKNIENLAETENENAEERGCIKGRDFEFYNLCEIEQ